MYEAEQIAGVLVPEATGDDVAGVILPDATGGDELVDAQLDQLAGGVIKGTINVGSS